MSNNVSKFFKAFLLTALLVLESGCSMASNAVPVKKSEVTVPKQQAIVVKKEEAKKSEATIDKEKANLVYGYNNGDKYLAKYQNVLPVRQLILVEQSESDIRSATLFLLSKNNHDDWRIALKCKAVLGINGIGKTREGDGKTPTGDFGMKMAFGAKDDPGSLIPYTKLTSTMYLCSDKEYYNQFIDVSKVKHTCSYQSEHLIRYIPQYNYALFFDYNKENVYGKGSAIFLHCFGSYPYTLGCIAVSEENMVKILKTVDVNARICIYPKQAEHK